MSQTYREKKTPHVSKNKSAAAGGTAAGVS